MTLTVKDVVARLDEKPLTEDVRDLLVDRVKDLEYLGNTTENSSSCFIGLTGFPGIGKTTMINLVKFNGVKAVIYLNHRNSGLEILSDLADQLAAQLLEKKEMASAKKQLKELQQAANRILIHSHSTNFEANASVVVASGGGSTSTTIMENEIVPARGLIKKLQAALKEITAKRRVLLCLDDLDKEQDARSVLIIKELYNHLKMDNLIVVFVLDAKFCDLICGRKDDTSELPRLENEIENPIRLNPVAVPEDVASILRKRIGLEDIGKVVDDKTLEVLAYASGGRPRNSIRYLRWTVNRVNKIPVSLADVMETLEQNLRKGHAKNQLGEQEWEMLVFAAQMGSGKTPLNNLVKTIVEKKEYKESDVRNRVARLKSIYAIDTSDGIVTVDDILLAYVMGKEFLGQK